MRLYYPKIRTLLLRALREDIGPGDFTSRSCISPRKRATASLIAKEEGIVCGTELAHHIFRILAPRTRIIVHKKDGEQVKPGDMIISFKGRARVLLAAERTIINFISHLSGIATLTRRYVDAIKNTKVTLLDTRKTLPGWRYLEKYATMIGGAKNHRMGLYDMALIKENHIIVAGNITNAVKLCRRKSKQIKIEVECETLTQVQEALNTSCNWIMLDNMNTTDMRKAVEMIQGEKKVEASGGVTLRNIVGVARTGVDYISVGAITHSAKSLDMSMSLYIE